MLMAPEMTRIRYNMIVTQSSDLNTDTPVSVLLDTTVDNCV